MSTTITLTSLEVDENGYDAAGAYYGAGQNGIQWCLEGLFDTRTGFTPHRLNRSTRYEATQDALAAIPARHRGEPVEIVDATAEEANLVS